MVNAVLLGDKDMVVTVTRPISSGDEVTFALNGKVSTVKAVSNIPVNHKVAIINVKKGDAVLKYGERIGYATADIKAGEHVHENNLDSRI